MGVVRQEGDWRLEKIEDGLYEVTYKETAEATITTPEYEPGAFGDQFAVSAPSYEADSDVEARSLFDEIAAQDTISVMERFGTTADGPALDGPSGPSDGAHGNGITNLPPGGLALVLVLVGGGVLYASAFAIGSAAFYLGSALVLGGIGIVAWASALYKSRGASEAVRFLIAKRDPDRSDSSATDAGEDSERTLPASRSLKEELYFNRANRNCEWCNIRVDQPEVHHIKPRREGGPNDPSNIIVLCAGCHAKADRGAISRTKLRARVRKLTESAA